MKKKWIVPLIVAGLLLFAGIGVFTKAIKLNTILASKYEVKGVDVSHYQGEEKYIDCNVFAKTEEELQQLILE